jgi:hypothetical protein
MVKEERVDGLGEDWLMERHHALCLLYIIGSYYPAPYSPLVVPTLHPTPPAFRCLRAPITQREDQTRGRLIRSRPKPSSSIGDHYIISSSDAITWTCTLRKT